MKRKEQIENGLVYHVCNKSIARYQIFNEPSDYERMIYLMRYCQYHRPMCFSDFTKHRYVAAIGFDQACKSISDEEEKRVGVVAYCIMPTHYHFVLKQLISDGISQFVGSIQNGYAKYFNAKHKRRGPLWVGPFRGINVETDEQLIHLTRYVHLNPVTSDLVKNATEWEASSYREFVGEPKLCEFSDLVDIDSKDYQNFVSEQEAYQKDLAKLKKLIEYT